MINNLQKDLKELTRKQASMKRQWDATGQRRLLKFIVSFIPKLLNVESCSIFIKDAIRSKVWLACATNLDEGEIEVPTQNSLVGEVIATGHYQIRMNMDKQSGIHTLVDRNTGFVTRNILTVPIKGFITKESIGAIQILNKHHGQEYTEDDRLVLEEAAYYLQMLIENIFLGQEAVAISEKIEKKIALLDIILWVWGAFVIMMILILIILVTPFAQPAINYLQTMLRIVVY